MLLLPSVFARSRSTGIAASFFGVSVLALAVLAKDEPRLAASGQPDGTDLDKDGLSDAAEFVIGTQPNQADSDGDGFSDLEEFARGSDPAVATSLPEPSGFSLAIGASQTGDMVTVLATVFSDVTKVGKLTLDFGVVHKGRLYRIYPRSLGCPNAYLLRGSGRGDRLTVIEIPLPAEIVRRVGQVNVVGILRDTTPGATEPSVSILPLVNFSDITMSVQQTPATMGVWGSNSRPAGIVYRPLAGSNQIPSTWNSGEICFQRTAAVGMDGVSTVFEIEAAGCLPMDTYCSPGNCGAGVGTSIDLPDPGALVGG